jgi:hypothetical protein
LQKYKHILLIAPHYFDYDLVIKKFLEEKGYLVDLINDRPYDSNIFKAIVRINRSLIDTFLNFFYKKQLLKISHHRKYQLIYIIQGEGLTPSFLKWLRMRNPDTPMIYYLWDSIKNKPKLKENFPYFDRVITFDSQDAKRFKIDFAPLFFSLKFKDLNKTKTIYDLSFIGSLHSDRGPLIKFFKKNAPHLRLFIYLYSPSRWIYFVRQFFNKNFRDIDLEYLYFQRLPYDKSQKIFLQSKVILDIHNANQTGLTIRTIEALSLGKKIATTNSNIKKYDFYNPQNIFILNRYHFAIPISFFKTPFKPVNQKIINSYSLENFYRKTIEPHLNKCSHFE